MLNRKFDPAQPYRYLRYGRMSSEKQNPRSPDQQFDTIQISLIDTFAATSAGAAGQRKRGGKGR